MRRIASRILFALAALGLTLAPLEAAFAAYHRDEGYQGAGSTCSIYGGSFILDDPVAQNGRAGITTYWGGCTAISLSGYYECDNGAGYSMSTTWAYPPDELRHFNWGCGLNAVYSNHLHNGCEYSNCSGTFVTAISDY